MLATDRVRGPLRNAQGCSGISAHPQVHKQRECSQCNQSAARVQAVQHVSPRDVGLGPSRVQRHVWHRRGRNPEQPRAAGRLLQPERDVTEILLVSIDRDELAVLRKVVQAVVVRENVPPPHRLLGCRIITVEPQRSAVHPTNRVSAPATLVVARVEALPLGSELAERAEEPFGDAVAEDTVLQLRRILRGAWECATRICIRSPAADLGVTDPRDVIAAPGAPRQVRAVGVLVARRCAATCARFKL